MVVGLLGAFGIYSFRKYRKNKIKLAKQKERELLEEQNRRMQEENRIQREETVEERGFDEFQLNELENLRNNLQYFFGDEFSLQNATPEELLEIGIRLGMIMNNVEDEMDYERLLQLDENVIPKGATEKQLKGLEIREYNKASENEINNCAICIDEFEENDQLHLLPCQHSFHSQCILKWLNRSKLCPICRYELK